MNNRLKPRYIGSAVAVTLIAIAAMTTITLGVAQLVPRDFRQAQALELSHAAENAAWAGVERALLELGKNPYFELSQELKRGLGRPYGSFVGFECNRMLSACLPGLDRALGIPTRLTPVEFGDDLSDLGKKSNTNYSLAVWHMVQNVGVVTGNDMDDSNSDHARGAANINPIIERDQAITLDVSDLSNAKQGSQVLTLRWAPIFHSQAPSGGSGQCLELSNSFYLQYTWLTESNEIYTDGSGEVPDGVRGKLDYRIEREAILRNPDSSRAVRLELRFLADTPDLLDSTIADCFARYAIKTTDSTVPTTDIALPGVDLGYSVIESTGKAATVQHKIRVTVDRENGSLVDIFDFGVVCQICKTGTQ